MTATTTSDDFKAILSVVPEGMAVDFTVIRIPNSTMFIVVHREPTPASPVDLSHLSA